MVEKIVENEGNLMTDREERDLLEEGEVEDTKKDGEEMPKVLNHLTQALISISSSMLNMEKSIKRLNETGSDEKQTKRRKTSDEHEDGVESDASDGVELLLQTKPQADSATEGETGVTCARLEHDADDLLSEISQDFEQEEDVGPNISQQLADIVNKRWSIKLNEAKMKEKMEKYSRAANCEKVVVPRVNTEIWDKLDNKAKHNDLRASAVQKSLTKVGAILALSTEKLVQMRNKNLPEVDKLVTLNTDALALLGHTMCELSMRRRDAIKPNLHTDYSSLCASHVPVTTFLFGDNLQTRLNDIRASNKISKTTVPERFGQTKGRGRFSKGWSNNNTATDSSHRKSSPFLYKGRSWKQHPPKPGFQQKKGFQTRHQQWQ